MDRSEALRRSRLLYGDEAIDRLEGSRVILFGVGGVGSWCAEALVRSGLGHITIVDYDTIDITNINRQAPAAADTVGQQKVVVMARRLLAIRPDCHVEAVAACYTDDNAEAFHLDSYDVVIDAIDSVASKASLILRASALKGVKLLSSMGAARKVDPGQVQDAEFWNVKGCPLARALRDKFKREGTFPARKFRCVYSPEAPTGEPKGSAMPVTATFGLRLAALAISYLTKS